MQNHIYGYARVSTQQQDLIRQLDLLKTCNCTEILTEKISGTKKDRPELMRLKDNLRIRFLIHNQIKTYKIILI